MRRKMTCYLTGDKSFLLLNYVHEFTYIHEEAAH